MNRRGLLAALAALPAVAVGAAKAAAAMPAHRGKIFDLTGDMARLVSGEHVVTPPHADSIALMREGVYGPFQRPVVLSARISEEAVKSASVRQ